MKAQTLSLLLSLAWVGTTLAQTPGVPTVTAPTPAPNTPAVATAAPAPAATPAPPPAAPAQRSAADLEKLAMPIALHPDPLISIMLPAAVYPVEIVQAARFVKDTNNIPKVDQQSWDENVKAVAKIPELIAQMDADLEWTVALGEAFLDQPKELMDTIQALRAKAHKAGTLQTTTQQIVTVTNVVMMVTNVTEVVTVTNQIVQVVSSNPQYVYVPTYTSTVYYPPVGYVYDPWAPLISFGVAVGVGAIIANNCDWHGGCVWVGGGGGVWVGGGGDVDIDVDIDHNVDRGDRPARGDGNRPADRGTRPSQTKWQPDQSRLRTSGATGTAQTRDARGWSGAGTQAAQRPAGGSAAARPTQAAARPTQPAARPTQPAARPTQPAARPAQPAARPTQPAQRPTAAARPAPSQPSTAFSGVNSGSSAQAASNRGAVSRSSYGGGGGGGGGGGRGGGGGGGGRRR